MFGYYEATSAIREEHLAKAYYSARGSVAALAKYLTTVPADAAEEQVIANYVTTIATDGVSATGSIQGVPYNLVVTQTNDFGSDPPFGILTLASTGTSGQFSKSAVIEIGYNLTEYTNDGPFGIVDSALYSFNEATSGGSEPNYKANAKGAVKTDLDPAGMLVDVLVPPYVPVLQHREYPMPNEPEFPTTLENRNAFIVDGDTAPDGSFSSTSVITVKSNTVYDGNNDRVITGGTIINKGTPTYILLKGLDIKSPLLFDGNAPVYIMVEDFLNIGADVGCSSKCKSVAGVYTHDPECWLGRVNIIYTGSDPITVSGNIRIRANIVSLQGSIKAIDISIGGNVIMSGHIICGGDEIKLHGLFEADKTMIYAPLAMVEVKGSAASNDSLYHITGAIVANHFNATAYFNIEYAAVTRASLPLWFDAEDSGGDLGDETQIGTGEYYPSNFAFTRWLK